jgi:membrane-bound metal-dependent hydrolase YbcI (DUF457 family)
MDNVTHSLAGLLVAEAAVRLRARCSGVEPSPRFRSVAAASSLVAANLPDADLFYTAASGGRLSYMLQHRGYTHTVVIAIVAAVLVWGAAALVWRGRTRAAPSRDDLRWLLGLLLASALSHLVLDWTNSYGVHPFWPLDDRWRYGDAVFIVEPWLWVVSVPALVAASRRPVARALLCMVLVIGLALAWSVPLVSVGADAGDGGGDHGGAWLGDSRDARSRSGRHAARRGGVAPARERGVRGGHHRGALRRDVSSGDGPGERVAAHHACERLRLARRRGGIVPAIGAEVDGCRAVGRGVDRAGVRARDAGARELHRSRGAALHPRARLARHGAVGRTSR